MRMTREMYESLQVKDLKGIAESRGMKSISRMRKETLVERLLQMDQEEDERVLRERELRAKESVSAQSVEPNAAGSKVKKESVSAQSAEPDAAESKVKKESVSAQPAEPDAAGSKGRKEKKESADVEGKPEMQLQTPPVQKEPRTTPEAKDAPAQPDSRLNPERAPEHRVTAEAGTQDSRTSRTGRPAAVRKPRRKAEPLGAVRSRSAGSAAENGSSARRERAQQPLPEATEATSPAVSAQTSAAQPAQQPSVSSAQETGGTYSAGSQQNTFPGPSAATAERYARRGLNRPDQQIVHKNELNPELDSGEIAHGILEVMGDGFGFIRSNNYMPGDNDVYVAPSQIRRFALKTGDIVEGNIRIRNQNEKFSALLYVKSVNGMEPEETKKRFNFEDMTPIFPNDRIRLEKPGASVAMRVMDLMCPVGKGQRGMIVSPPKAGKTTLLKEVARSIKYNDPEIHLIILLIDERPEEVTDIREALEGPNVEVIHSTFDELPEHHKRVAEMTIERAKRLVEHRKDVVILLDSITRLTRAYNLTEPSSGRTLSGGLDPVALHMPKRFFGAARNMREGGSLTILATALIETGSKMDDVVYEEFKGTGNMEMILNRKLSERRIFPAVDLVKSGTRRDDLLLTPDEQECVATIRRAFIGSRGEEATDSVLDLFGRTRTNGEFVNMIKKHMWSF